MTSSPPRLASALMRRLGPQDETLAGDLVEAYGAGRSATWFWRQVLTAIVVCAMHHARTRPWLALRGVAGGWTALLLFFAVFGRDLNQFFNGWVLDQLIFARWEALAAGSDVFVMAYATHFHGWPVAACGFLLSGCAAARLNRTEPAAALLLFVVTVIVVSALATGAIWLTGGPRALPAALRFLLIIQLEAWWTGFLVVPCLILLGGLCGTASGRRVVGSLESPQGLS